MSDVSCGERIQEEGEKEREGHVESKMDDIVCPSSLVHLPHAKSLEMLRYYVACLILQRGYSMKFEPRGSSVPEAIILNKRGGPR